MAGCECHVNKAYKALSVRLGTEGQMILSQSVKSARSLPRGQVGGKWSGQRKQLMYRGALGNLSRWEKLELSVCGKRTERGG